MRTASVSDRGWAFYTERRVLPLALLRLTTFLPPAVLMRFRNPCSRFCLRLLFCAVVSDIYRSFAARSAPARPLRTEAYYNRKQAYVKGKNPGFRDFPPLPRGFDFLLCFWYRILPMRKGIDHIGVGVGAVILNSGGKVLLARRGRGAGNGSGTREFPGGGVEFGELLKDAPVRERTA